MLGSAVIVPAKVLLQTAQGYATGSGQLDRVIPGEAGTLPPIRDGDQFTSHKLIKEFNNRDARSRRVVSVNQPAREVFSAPEVDFQEG
jgi:hypothetical protein